MALDPITAISDLATSVVNVIRTRQDAKAQVAVAEAQAKAAALQKAAEQEGSWENIWAAGAQTSWKDEFWTIIFSIPLVLCFCGPAAVQIVMDGFHALALTPVWYRNCLFVAVAGAFGLRGLTKWINR